MRRSTYPTRIPASLFGATLLATVGLLLVSCAQAPQGRRVLPSQDLQSIRFGEATCSIESYPPEAARANATGTTRAKFEVDPEGKVSNAVVIVSAGPSPQHQLLDAATLRMLATCTYPPRPGQTENVVKKIEYVWRLAR